MTLIDAAASTAFAALRPTPSSGGGSGGIARHQQGGTDANRSSAATRLGSIDPVTPHEDERGERTTPPGRLFSFGAIADVQYADQDDGWNFKKDHRRYYRGGLRQLRGAVDVWLKDETHRFVLQLGDVIDGSNKAHGKSETALRSVKAEVDRLAASLPLGVLNSLGNHELYNFPKQRWARELDCSSRAKAVTLRPSACGAGAAETIPTPVPSGLRPETDNDQPSAGLPPSDEPLILEASRGAGHEGRGEEEECFYYSFSPVDSYRFIALDSYDVNAIREEPRPDEEDAECSGKDEAAAGDGRGDEGMRVLSKHNPNTNKNDGGGLEGLTKRFVQYNGGIGAKQLLWLENQLTEASRAGQRVVGFGHVPIHPAEPGAHTLIWNYEEVLAVMHKFDCVAMFLSGHRHRETYFRDENGIHHISLAAALEAPSDQEAFASVDVYDSCLELRGHGVVESRVLDLAVAAKVS
ncbi:unnamed protein product [Ectocarpus sp. 12 AP-2014]